MPDTTRHRELAERALRTPDLEWAHDLVHGLANAVLELAADEVDDPDVRDPGIVELKALMTELLRESSNIGLHTSVGRLCVAAHDALYWLVRALIEEER